MSTSLNNNSQQEKSTVGLLLIIGDIISNEQRDEICLYLEEALKQIDSDKYHEINNLFDKLIRQNEFQPDSQYRQIANTENGSTAGFLYLPNFHTVLNVLKDLLNTCYHVCIIFCGQQIDTNGALILSDSIFTCDNFHSLFEENTSSLTRDLQIILPFVSNQWTKLSNNYLQKKLQNVEINDIFSGHIQENSFGQGFYERFVEMFNNESIDFDIYTKLIPRDSSGTIAFDEPNLYVLYGQQGDASLFGVRGFVLLVNGGFSGIPSYWNLIRGLQKIDACILTHFDYDVLPGLQTILHRKTISLSEEDQICKPDIGAIFLNHIQRTKMSVVKSSSNSKLLMNLSENIDQLFNNIKQLKIDTFDLVKHTVPNKQSVEPINLYRKIAFGSLDLYVLHPTASTSDDDKIIAALQKIPIRDQQVSSSVIPLHHWYSSCSLLVWTPTSKSKKDSLVRILYTGACPQTLVFEALNRVPQLKFLHESQQQQQTVRTSSVRTSSLSARTNSGVRRPLEKTKVSPPISNRMAPSTADNRTKKAPSHRDISKPKVPQTTTMKSEKSRSTSSTKKTPSSVTTSSARSTSKDNKIQKPPGSVSKTSTKSVPIKKQVVNSKGQNDQKQKLKVQNEPKKDVKTHNDHEHHLEIQDNHEQPLESQNQHEKEEEVHHDNAEEKLEYEDESIIENEHKQDVEFETEYEQNLENEFDDEQLLEIQNNEDNQANEIEQDVYFQDVNEEETKETDEHQMSADELDEKSETSVHNHEDDIKQPELLISTIDHHEESLIESNPPSPMDELKLPMSPHNPMTASFVDGMPNTQNPFDEKIDEHYDNDDDEMEIIHHAIPSSPKYSKPSIDDIEPQGLPIEQDVPSNKSTPKKIGNGSNRINRSTTTVNNTNKMLSRQSKATSGSIFNVDVAYIPYHGNEHYVDREFFRRIRARYYILNAVQISRLTLESLIDGKQQWDKQEHLPVTLVPTFDGDQLRQFFLTNKNRLAELNISILPAATRCNVQYDGEGSPAQRLRLSSIHETDDQ